DVRLERLHAGGRNLTNHYVPIAVEHQSGQLIRLAENQPVVRCLAQALTQRERHLETLFDESAIEWLGRVATHDPRANQRMGIYISVAEELIPIGHHSRQRARGKTC